MKNTLLKGSTRFTRIIAFLLVTVLSTSNLFFAHASTNISQTAALEKTMNPGAVSQPGEIPFDEVTEGELITISGGASDPRAFSHEEIGTIQALPLKHTSVYASITGFVSRTTVTQEFQNPYQNPIEAIYHFPLPHEASIDGMEMQIGDKKIIGKIDTRKAAEQKYQEAKQQGKTAALLNQERPNIFTQKVANILPGDAIKITISYFEVLQYEQGEYNFVFPMVVGPRYNPSSVTDAHNIVSPSMPAGTRAGHTIDLTLHINAGVNIQGLKSNSHDVSVKKISDSEAEISLKKLDTIPNKDFSFIYNVASDTPQIGLLTHKIPSEKDGYFTLIAEPQKAPKSTEIRNKEIVFVLDTSGSMSGRPIETVKLAMKKAISNLGPNDYFNVFNFNTQVFSLYPKSKKVDDRVRSEALAYVDALQAGGGTMMLAPFKEALQDDGDHGDRMRIILGMTDGDVGNESEILKAIHSDLGKNRLFMLGVDAAANRYLIDKMAESGNGKATYVLGEDSVEDKVDEFYQTFASPVLTDITIDWDGLVVSDILPVKFADLYAGQPLYISGKYTNGGLFDTLDRERNIKISAMRGNESYTQIIKMNFRSEEQKNSSIAAYWARKKIDSMYREHQFTLNSKLEEEVTALGLRYAIMSEFTSFVAIDDTVRNTTGTVQTYDVPVYEVEGKNSMVQDVMRTMGNSSTPGAMMYENQVNGKLKGAAAPTNSFIGNMMQKAESAMENSTTDKIATYSMIYEVPTESKNVISTWYIALLAALIGLMGLSIVSVVRSRNQKKESMTEKGSNSVAKTTPTLVTFSDKI